MIKLNNKAFSLPEVLVAILVFSAFALGVFGGLNLIVKIVYQAKIKIIETGLLNEDLEEIKTLAYEDVGINGGLPAGILDREEVFNYHGLNFKIVRTIRNIDDPYDGLIGGEPNDNSPADYKLVQIDIYCLSCQQDKPLSLNTLIAPKHLEGDSDNGALFIRVFDKNGQVIPQANVEVVNSDLDPDLIIQDTTDNDGWLRIVDVPTGTLAYNIQVSKDGYSSDYTLPITEENPNPFRLPANVVKQEVTEVNFSIDKLSQINLQTIDTQCQNLGDISFNLHGEKIIGSEPVIYKYDEDQQTDENGHLLLSNLEWDTYYLSLNNNNYNLAGSIPILPLNLEPDNQQDLSLILQPATENSLLVNVVDSGTNLPLANASVSLSGQNSEFSKTLITGLGYLTQTDWSGGDGQNMYIFNDKYWQSFNVSVNEPVGDIILLNNNGQYVNSGWLESSTIDFGANVVYRNMSILPENQIVGVGEEPIKIQIATSEIEEPAEWVFLGPDASTSTFYTNIDNVVNDIHDGQRYLRYKIYLSTADPDLTPHLAEISFTYTNQCTPPGQVFFNNLEADDYDLSISQDDYLDTEAEININGYKSITVKMSINE